MKRLLILVLTGMLLFLNSLTALASTTTCFAAGLDSRATSSGK